MNSPIEIRLKRLPHGEGLPIPALATRGAAGMDVVAAEDVIVPPGGVASVTGPATSVTSAPSAASAPAIAKPCLPDERLAM